MGNGRKPGVSRYASHPIVKYVRSLPEELYLAREVAEQVGCTPRMLSYIAKHSDTPMGPTHQAQYGSVVLHLYTPQRIEAIAARLARDPSRKRIGRIPLWTATEHQNRRRDRDRFYDYRNRAQAYRAAGEDKKAARMDKMAATLGDRLEKTRLARWQKVHGAKKPR